MQLNCFECDSAVFRQYIECCNCGVILCPRCCADGICRECRFNDSTSLKNAEFYIDATIYGDEPRIDDVYSNERRQTINQIDMIRKYMSDTNIFVFDRMQDEICYNCGIRTNELGLCSFNQPYKDECKFNHRSLCGNCLQHCPNCDESYCYDCWNRKDEIEYPCQSHRHCPVCPDKPDICNVYPQSACGCGCGDYPSRELIWNPEWASDEDVISYMKNH